MKRMPDEWPIGNEGYTETILGQVYAVLRPHGFRRDGVRFYAERPDATLVVELQSSLDSRPDFVDVTVNLGVYSHPLAERLGAPPVTDPRPRVCHWQERFSRLLPDGGEVWWRAEDELQALEAGARLAAMLRLYGLPALARRDSTVKLRDLWASGEPDELLDDADRRRYLDALGR